MRQVETPAQEGLDESRRVVSALAPRDLTDTGLTAALHRTLDSLSQSTGIDATLHVDGDVTSLPTTVEVALLRVAQGALAISIRGGVEPSKVTRAELRRRKRQFMEDINEAAANGKMERAEQTEALELLSATEAAFATPDLTLGGYGLRASRERLRDLGGGLDVESRPGDGTALTAYLPLGGVRS